MRYNTINREPQKYRRIKMIGKTQDALLHAVKASCGSYFLKHTCFYK